MTKRPEIVDLALQGKLHLLEDVTVYPMFGDSALCIDADPEIFFSEEKEDVSKAIAMCNSCPLIASCLEWALRNEEYGIFGGRTPAERETLQVNVELLPATTIQAWKKDRTQILGSTLKEASSEFGVTERTVLRWRQALEPERKAG